MFALVNKLYTVWWMNYNKGMVSTNNMGLQVLINSLTVAGMVFTHIDR